jgi:hypothetical protein
MTLIGRTKFSGFHGGCWSAAGLFGLLHQVVVECSDISEEYTASIFRVTECGSGETFNYYMVQRRKSRPSEHELLI